MGTCNMPALLPRYSPTTPIPALYYLFPLCLPLINFVDEGGDMGGLRHSHLWEDFVETLPAHPGRHLLCLVRLLPFPNLGDNLC